MKSNEIVLALDFDGVICNSIDECLITSYNAFYESEINNVSDIPDDIKSFFYTYRHYVRPAREYYLIHKAFQKKLTNFDLKIFNQLQNKYRHESRLFEPRFYKMRSFLKQDKEHWISLHRIYDHVREFFWSYENEFFIVTTKDKDSVEILSEHFGFRKKIKDIFSKEISIDKRRLFKKLFSKYDQYLVKNKLAFVDDNEFHLAQVQDFPLELYFAAWGYSGKQYIHSFKPLKKMQELS